MYGKYCHSERSLYKNLVAELSALLSANNNNSLSLSPEHTSVAFSTLWCVFGHTVECLWARLLVSLFYIQTGLTSGQSEAPCHN